MSDQPVPTIVHTDEGELAFQDYFVRRRCAPRVQRLEYRATAGARLSPALDRVSRSPELEGIVICPSNPYLSIGPILALPGMRAAIAGSRAALAVSPVIAGKAVKGPTAKIMGELGIEPTALAIARFYEGLIDALVIDAADAALSSAIQALGVEVLADDTLMETHEDRVRVARTCLSRLRRRA
jgi:LPPG:FO 2-phospho-L-lactate transferase